jgi:hypothetical protein
MVGVLDWYRVQIIYGRHWHGQVSQHLLVHMQVLMLVISNRIYFIFIFLNVDLGKVEA